LRSARARDSDGVVWKKVTVGCACGSRCRDSGDDALGIARDEEPAPDLTA
jgi:hypothetical protein